MVYPTPDTTPTNAFEVNPEPASALDSGRASPRLSDAIDMGFPHLDPLSRVAFVEAVSIPAPPEINIEYAPPSRLPLVECNNTDSLSAPACKQFLSARLSSKLLTMS